jgi:hypothetical protein
VSVRYNILGGATSAVLFFRSMCDAVGLAVFALVVTNRFALEFARRLPAKIKAVYPTAAFVIGNTWCSGAAQFFRYKPKMKALFDQLGQHGVAFYGQTLRA